MSKNGVHFTEFHHVTQ